MLEVTERATNTGGLQSSVAENRVKVQQSYMVCMAGWHKRSSYSKRTVLKSLYIRGWQLFLT